MLILFWLLFSGPGPYSVDSMMARRWTSPQSTGRAGFAEERNETPHAQRLFGNRHRSRRVYLPGRPARPHAPSGWRERNGLPPWAVASGLLLVHAMGMQSVVFTVLMISQIICCVLIAALATIYRRFGSPGGDAGSMRPSAPDRPEP